MYGSPLEWSWAEGWWFGCVERRCSRDIVDGVVPNFVGDEGDLPDVLWLAPEWRADPGE
jgi:hypothetical protein